jgi:hypothetical protein
LPLFSGRFDISKAAYILAPHEIPDNIPSSVARRREVSIASSFFTGKISSTSHLSKLPGTKFAPIP